MSLTVGSVLLQSSLGPFWFGKVTDPLSQLTQCLLRSRNINIQGSVHYLFIPAVCIQGSLGCPLVSFAELLVCQLGVSSPYNNQTWNWKGKGPLPFWAELCCRNKSRCQWAHWIHQASLSHIFGVPGWAQSCSSSSLVWQPCTVAAHNHPLHCWSGGLIRLMSTYSQVGSILHTCKEVHWWQLNRSLPHPE